MCTPIYKMITSTKDPKKCKKIDFLRVKKYTSCYIYQNRNAPLEDLIKRARAPIEHLFNVHEWCDPEWCWAKSLGDDQEKMMSHVRDFHKNNSLVCMPCNDSTPSATGPNCCANSVASATSPNGDVNISRPNVTGATGPNCNATIAGGKQEFSPC